MIGIVTPYPLSPGDNKILFDIAGEGCLSRADCEMFALVEEEPGGSNGGVTDEQLARYAPSFRAAMQAFEGSILLLLDTAGAPLLRTFGITPHRIESMRGYAIAPGDCRSAVVREQVVIGQYKRDGKHGKKGDDRYGFVSTEREPPLPPRLDWLLPTLHPRSIRVDGLKSLPCLRKDVQRAVAFANGARPVEFTYQSSTFPAGPSIALDLETSGSTITLVGVSNGTETWAQPWNACSADKVNKLMRQECVWKVFHNAPFDISWLEREGIEVRGRVFDTMLAAHLIQPDLYKGLEKSATLYLDLRPFKHLSTSELARPAADAQVSALMFTEQWRILGQTGQLDFFIGTIMPAVRVLMGMTKRGLRVDMARLDTWQSELSTKLRSLMGQWAEYTPVNPFSPPQLKRYLYGELGLPEQSSRYADVTTDEGAIKALIEQFPEHSDQLSLLLSIRETAKLKSTYSEVSIGPDGCVHPNYLPVSKDTDRAGAATGRLASSDPNIQNQPPEARRLFVPHEEGMVLVEADFSQIELRIAGVLSQDTQLLNALSGSDPFGPIMSVLACDRVRAKNVIYGSLYGAGPPKLSRLLNAKGIKTTISECKALQTRLAQAYPQLWGWRTAVAQEAKDRRVLTNPFGRKRYFYGEDTPAAIDYLPQSTAADILWSVLKDCESAAKESGGYILTTVHDSILFGVPRDGIDVAIGRIRGCLEREWPQIAPGFRVPVKVKVGNDWGTMEEYEPGRLDSREILPSH